MNPRLPPCEYAAAQRFAESHFRRWIPPSDAKLGVQSQPIGEQEGNDLVDGWLVGDHAGVALVLVQGQAGAGDAVGSLAEQLRV